MEILDLKIVAYHSSIPSLTLTHPRMQLHAGELITASQSSSTVR